MKKLLLYNAKVYIGKNQFEEAVYVENEVIKRVGKNEDLLSFCDNSVEKLDLEGRVVLPGLNDSHMHFLNIGYNAYQLDLGETKSIDDAIELCRKYIEEHNIPEGRWVQCYGWNDDNWTEKRNMTRYDLDKVSDKHPIMSVRICGHVTTVNSYVLLLLRIIISTVAVESTGFWKCFLQYNDAVIDKSLNCYLFYLESLNPKHCSCDGKINND